MHYSPVATGELLGAKPPQTKLQAPKLKHETLNEFLSIFRVSSPPTETQSPPIENFLATVLMHYKHLLPALQLLVNFTPFTVVILHMRNIRGLLLLD